MDDLSMLRDLGRELEHEPPVTLARQRQRLTDMAAGRAGRRTHWCSRAGRMNAPAAWIALAAVAVVTAALIVVPTALLRRPTVNTDTLDGPRRNGQSGPMNVLVLGSDSRAGADAKYGQHMVDDGERSDLMLLLHLSADRKNVTAVSLPRDSMVTLPACQSADGKIVASHLGMINSAYQTGGLICARRTVETLTGLHVDHAVAIRFSGFEKIIDALGGVDITLPVAVDDRQSKLKMPAGRHHVNGAQALAYARLRHFGDGSDVQRIKRQAGLMNAMLKQIKGQMNDPARLIPFVNVARQSVTADQGLDVETMLSIAREVQQAEPRITYVTVPWRPFSADPNRLEWKQPAADRLFAQLRND